MKNQINSKEVLDIRDYLVDKFSNLKFEETYHRYTVNGQEHQSVTTFLKEFSDAFNEHIMAPLVAKKYNKENPDKKKRSAEWYKRYWRAKRDEAAARGTRVHQFAEMFPDFGLPSCDQERAVLQWFETLDPKYIILFSEFKIYDVETKKAGTIDLLLYNTETGKLVIIDWKTNTTNILQYYAKKKLKFPFNKYHANGLSKYRLQLSHYQYILEKNTNLKVEDRWIVWLNSGDHTLVDSDKNPDNYNIESINPTIECEGSYKQFNLESLTDKLIGIFNAKKENEDKSEESVVFGKKVNDTKKKIESAKKKLKAKANYKKNK